MGFHKVECMYLSITVNRKFEHLKKASILNNLNNVWAILLKNFSHIIWFCKSNLCSKCPNFISNVLKTSRKFAEIHILNFQLNRDALILDRNWKIDKFGFISIDFLISNTPPYSQDNLKKNKKISHFMIF
jgi:hypothetical protein